MIYNTKSLLNRKVPAYAGIFVLLMTLGLTVLLSGNSVQFVSKATIGSEPKNLQVSNITATSFTVSYETDQTAVSTIAYGKDSSLGNVAQDVRDIQNGGPVEHRIHYVTIQNLEPGTRYYYTITSGATVADNSGSPFEITTPANVSSPPPANGTISGSVALEDGTFPNESIVYISSDNSQLISALVQPDGRFTTSLAQLRTKDLATYLPILEKTPLKITATNAALQSEVSVVGEQLAEVPKIILSKNYDFTLSGDDPLASDSGSSASQSAGFPIFDEQVSVNSPTITTPEDQQIFKDPQPLFKGRALPNTGIEIVISSDNEIVASLQSDSTGLWEFRPPVELSPGPHTITISSIDAKGALQKLSRSFTVNASGGQFTEPSVSPIQPTQGPPVTPTVASLPSPTPTLAPSPTATPTAIPSPTIDPNAISPTRGPLSPTGSYSTVAGIITSMLFLAGGVILFFTIAV